MRGLLAIMVLVSHVIESARLIVRDATVPPWMEVVFGNGGFWVNGFFVLSGFCIHQAILNLRKKGGEFGAPYFLARVTRLYPLYLVALMLGIMVSGWLGFGSLLSHLLMLQGITGVLPAVKPAWSLTYEAAYYVAWPLVLAGCSWRPGRAFAVSLVGTLLLTGVLFAAWKRLWGADVQVAALPMALIAAQFPLWLGGALLAQCWETWVPHVRPWLLSVSVCWIIGIYVAHLWLLGRHVPVSVFVMLGWLGLPGWLGLVLGSTHWPGLRVLTSAAGWLGMLSYPLYILHQPLLDAVVAVVHARGMSLGFAEACFILGGFVMACMVVAGVPLEAWFLAWRAGFLKRRQTTIPA
ncbi:MAG: hypothetical protein B7Z37_07675 [Verrucomicrobia bacterium 12-59-8]|nr:MAG: hypothetical protein B7Z37_07675 [Verrucomicrobia bacterium 12-59-8]